VSDPPLPNFAAHINSLGSTGSLSSGAAHEAAFFS